MNVDSSLTLIASPSDRDHLDGLDDGAQLVKRGGTSVGNYEAIRSLGTVEVSDVGHTVIT